MAIRASGRNVSTLTRRTMAVIMAGGRGARLHELTTSRAKPATPFGGKFRIIDFPLSNCVNSGIRQILVMTQYKAHSLIQHVQKGWGYLRGELGEFVQLVPAQQQLGELWYRGTADCVYQNLDIIRDSNPEHVLILAGDHIYKMDYGPMLSYHVQNEADITVGVIQVPLEQARGFGIMTVEGNNRIVRFAEKPQNPEPMPGKPDTALASMGIYVFGTQFLNETLCAEAERPGTDFDFGKNIIPGSIGERRVFAYPFQDVETRAQKYWRDVGTVDAFFDANLELVAVKPELNLYDADWPIWTYQEQLPPAKFVLDYEGTQGRAVNSMVSGGCIISGAAVRQSLLFSNVRVHEGSYLTDTVVMPDVRIGKNCRITRAIIDEGCQIPDNTVIGEDTEADEKRFHRTAGGVCLVCPAMIG